MIGKVSVLIQLKGNLILCIHLFTE